MTEKRQLFDFTHRLYLATIIFLDISRRKQFDFFEIIKIIQAEELMFYGISASMTALFIPAAFYTEMIGGLLVI